MSAPRGPARLAHRTGSGPLRRLEDAFFARLSTMQQLLLHQQSPVALRPGRVDRWMFRVVLALLASLALLGLVPRVVRVKVLVALLCLLVLAMIVILIVESLAMRR